MADRSCIGSGTLARILQLRFVDTYSRGCHGGGPAGSSTPDRTSDLRWVTTPIGKVLKLTVKGWPGTKIGSIRMMALVIHQDKVFSAGGRSMLRAVLAGFVFGFGTSDLFTKPSCFSLALKGLGRGEKEAEEDEKDLHVDQRLL